jgi:hypothetical protein
MTFEKGHKKVGGRRKGSINKNSQLLKDTILQAGTEAHVDGLTGFLTQQAQENPTSFLTLLGKILPLQLAEQDEDIHEPITDVTVTIYHADQMPDQTEVPKSAAPEVING